jgi:HopA1 effector protein family
MSQSNQQIQQSDASAMSLIEVLKDIVSQIQIQPDLCITHPHFDPLELRSEVFSSLQTLSITLQDQYLRLRLGNYLYSIYDSDGNLSHINSDRDPNRDSESVQSGPAFNMAQGLKSTFYSALHNYNAGKGYFDPGWLVLKETSDGLLATRKDDLMIHVSRDRHLALSDRSAIVGERVAILLPPNLLEDECYVAVSNAGPPHQSDQFEALPLLNLYFNLNAEGVLTLMKELTTALNDLGLPFKLRAPIEETDYSRRPDAISLTFHKAHYYKIQPLIGKLYQKQQYRSKTPLFAKFLAPGLALAEQPCHTFTPQENFSLNRYQIVAEGVLNAWRLQISDRAERMNLIRQRFSAYQLNLDHPYLNPGSEDLGQSV